MNGASATSEQKPNQGLRLW